MLPSSPLTSSPSSCRAQLQLSGKGLRPMTLTTSFTSLDLLLRLSVLSKQNSLT